MIKRQPQPKSPINKFEFDYIKHYLEVSAKKEGLSMERRADFVGRDLSTLYRIRKSKSFAEYQYRVRATHRRAAEKAEATSPRSKMALMIIAIAYVLAWLCLGYLFAQLSGKAR